MLPRISAAFLLSLTLAVAQDDGARKPGAVFRSDIDALIAKLSAAAKVGNDGAAWGPLGGDSVVATAQILCAMGHCHRFYHVSDGPLLRASLEQIVGAGAGKVIATDAAAAAIVADAIAVIDPKRARASEASASSEHGFDAMVTKVVKNAAPGRWPHEVGVDASKRAKEIVKSNGPLPTSEAAVVLLQMVVCQAANRALDRHDAGPSLSAAEERGYAWLASQQKNGQFAGGGARALPMTGFGLMALQTKPVAARTPAERAVIEAGCRALLAQQNADGSFGESLQNYTTCVAIGALKRWGDPAATEVLAKAQRALLSFQNVERAGYARGDRDYGSIGYGGSQRGDLSNLHFALQALGETGLPKDHEAFAKAVVFLQRTQNLRSHNDWSGPSPDPEADGQIREATSGDDGGAGYYPGNSSAGYVTLPDGRVEPRSYGSMTYALLKAYTLAGLPADDPRVRAASDWLRRNWTLERNPGVDAPPTDPSAYQGLFYYYLLMAQALDLMQVRTFEVEGKPVDWRRDLRRQLESMQKPDGSWTNGKNSRWMEGDALLCTCYALLALERCR